MSLSSAKTNNLASLRVRICATGSPSDGHLVRHPLLRPATRFRPVRGKIHPPPVHGAVLPTSVLLRRPIGGSDRRETQPEVCPQGRSGEVDPALGVLGAVAVADTHLPDPGVTAPGQPARGLFA